MTAPTHVIFSLSYPFSLLVAGATRQEIVTRADNVRLKVQDYKDMGEGCFDRGITLNGPWEVGPGWLRGREGGRDVVDMGPPTVVAAVVAAACLSLVLSLTRCGGTERRGGREGSRCYGTNDGSDGLRRGVGGREAFKIMYTHQVAR